MPSFCCTDPHRAAALHLKLLSQISFSSSFICFNSARRGIPACPCVCVCVFADLAAETCVNLRVGLGCLCSLHFHMRVCVCVFASNRELLCGDSRYNICKPLLLCWISNGLKTSPLSAAAFAIPPPYAGTVVPPGLLLLLMRKADRAVTDTFISLTAADADAF